MKYSFVYVMLSTLCILLLIGCQCDHDWSDATCTEVKSCTICGETQGEVSGHVESDWQNDTDTLDVENLTIEAYKCCTVCDEILDSKTINLDSLHDGTCFLFSPLEYTNRLGYILETLNYTQYSTQSEFEPYYMCAINDNSKSELIASLEPMSACFVSGKTNLIMEKQSEKDVCEIHNTLRDYMKYENLYPLMSAILMTCDPSLDSDSALEVIESIPVYYTYIGSGNPVGIGDPYCYNGISYTVTKPVSGTYNLIISVSGNWS